MNAYLPLAGSMAWPLAALCIAYLFRREVRLALARVGQVKYRDFEMTFREDLHQAEALARTVVAAPPPRMLLEVGQGEPVELAGSMIADAGGVVVAPPAAPQPPRDLERLARIVDRSPREAILGAWDEVQRALNAASARLGERRGGGPGRSVDAIHLLAGRGRLEGPELKLVERLKAIRDRASRLAESEPRPTPDEARRFLDLALPAAARIDARP